MNDEIIYRQLLCVGDEVVIIYSAPGTEQGATQIKKIYEHGHRTYVRLNFETFDFYTDIRNIKYNDIKGYYVSRLDLHYIKKDSE